MTNEQIEKLAYDALENAMYDKSREFSERVKDIAAAIRYGAAQAEPVAIKPLDVSNMLRHAFMSGAGYKPNDRISESDIARWAEYDPDLNPAFRRVLNAALTTPPAPQPVEVDAIIERCAAIADRHKEGAERGKVRTPSIPMSVVIRDLAELADEIRALKGGA